MKRMSIGLIQMANPVSYARDYSSPSVMVAETARNGADLILFPETLPSGYFPNQNAWRVAEKADGHTVQWASTLAVRFRVTIGAGFVEHDGLDFYNTYFLADESGVLGYVRKRMAETYCYAVGSTLPFVDTKLGRLGVGICADNQMTAFLCEMKSHDVDIMLMPHARATPFRTGRGVTKSDITETRLMVEALPVLYSRILGVPTVYVNPVGTMEEMTGILGKFMSPDIFRLQGNSCIAVGGAVLGRMGGQEEAGVFDVDLTKEVPSEMPPDHSGWLFPGNALLRRVMIPLDTWHGRSSYRRRKTESLKGSHN